MAATATSSNIKARGKVMWSGGGGGDDGGTAGHVAPAPAPPPVPLPQGPLTCAWRVKRQLVLGWGDTGHVGPFHVGQAVIVPKGTMEVFIRGQGGQPGDRQGDLGYMQGKQSRQGLLGRGGAALSPKELELGQSGVGAEAGGRRRRTGGSLGAGSSPGPAPGGGGRPAASSGRVGSGCPRSSTATGWPGLPSRIGP